MSKSYGSGGYGRYGRSDGYMRGRKGGYKGKNSEETDFLKNKVYRMEASLRAAQKNLKDLQEDFQNFKDKLAKSGITMKEYFNMAVEAKVTREEFENFLKGKAAASGSVLCTRVPYLYTAISVSLYFTHYIICFY